MIIENLEARLKETGKLDEFNRDISKLKDEDSRTLVKLVLGIALNLHENGLENDYTFYGGQSVLVSLIKHLGTSVIYEWRGSSDIDMVCNNQIRYHLQRFVDIVSDRASPKVRGKRTIRLKPQSSDKSFKIDLRMEEAFQGEPHETYKGETEIAEVYGIPVRVLNLMKQFKSKLDVTRSLERDDVDVVSTLFIFYKQGYKPIQTFKDLNQPQKQRLYNLLKRIDENFISNYTLFIKSESVPAFLKYIRNLKDAVRRVK